MRRFHCAGRPRHSLRPRACAGFAATPAFCLVVTVLATVFALNQTNKLSLRKAPGFIRYRVVEATFRKGLDTVTDGGNFLRLMGAVAVSVAVGAAVMRTVKSANDTGWLRFLPFSETTLAIAGAIVLALFAAGARIYVLPLADPYVSMGMDVAFMTIGALCAVAGKMSQL